LFIAMKTILLILGSVLTVGAQPYGGRTPGAAPASNEPRGLRLKTARATQGLTLFAPLTSETTYAIDMDGQVKRTWKSKFVPSGWLYLLENGHILRGGSDLGASGFSGGGAGGRLQEFTWDGELVWDFTYNNDRLPHHDVAVLPNGHIVAICWERKTPEESRQAGRREGFVPKDGLWPDMLVEFEKQGRGGAKIVWEWHMWDHRVPGGSASEHPELIDINADLIGTATAPQDPPGDMFHTNAIAYNAELDQFILSVPRFNEAWVIDHSTSTQQAAGHSGGRSGKGGDLLYRWGNPQAYGRGTAAQQLFGFQHNARWVEPGLPGAGHMMVFSNRTPREKGAYTKVYEFAPPVDRAGRYTLADGEPYGPAEPVWTYSAPNFDANYISGAQRMANGNTFITSGPQGRFFEVTSQGEIVWEYWSPYSGSGSGAGPNGSANPFSVFRATRVPANHPGIH
jgi:Arylsulfotransferase (ASST)